ncbi:MAG TPA: phage portal protein [Rhodocyclaceae bacterium]|nr:phage portal protein [Rhodocyclaceae bacterium]
MFLSRIQAGAADDRSPWGDFWFKPVPSRGGVNVAGDGALKLPVVLACVRVLSESFSVLPLKMYDTSGDARKLIKKHWLNVLISKRPNPWQTPFEWREMMMGHLAMRGNAYNEIVTDRRGNITQLTPLNPDRIKIEFTNATSDWDYRYRYTDRAGTEHVFTRGEIWHLKGLSSDGIMGLSPLAMAAQSVGMGLAAQEYGSRFFQNDAKPGGGWIEYPGTFKEKAARDTFRESFQEAQTGLNRGKIAVLEYGMKFHELGLTNKDSQFLEARQFQVSDIARIFRIPPHLVGDLSKATFSNIEQQSLDFVIHTMTPWAERWESSMEFNFLPDTEEVEPEFDFTALLRGDQAARGAFYHNGITDGWMLRADARNREGLPPIAGLDKPLMPLNMVTVDENGDAETPPPASPSAPATKTPEKPNENARMVALLQGNAARMARRLAAGNAPEPDVLADALAVPVTSVLAWLADRNTAANEDEITAQLMEIGA